MILKFFEKKKEVEDITTFIFEPEEPIVWQAGQFMVYSLPHTPEDIRGRQRFFTISSAPFEKFISISTKITETPSSFKKALDSMNPGDEIFAKGPGGDFVIEDPNKNYVFLAGGIGITPYRSIILQFAHEKRLLNFSLLYSGQTNEMPFEEELNKSMINFPKSKVIKKTEKVNEDDLKHFDKNSIFYISGPDGFVEEVFELLQKIGIPEENIKSDYFSGYDSI